MQSVRWKTLPETGTRETNRIISKMERISNFKVTVTEVSMIFIELMIAAVFGAFIGFLTGRYNR